MNRIADRSNRFVLGCGLALSLFLPLASAHGQVTTIYTFTGGNDGGNPPCGLISGGKGLLPGKARFYGTTQVGGTSGYGTVFQVGNTGSESVIHSFAGGTDGATPTAGVVTDLAGNIYGTTYGGGASGVGVVFKLTGAAETLLHTFGGGSDGESPYGGLVMDGSGNIYGTTLYGGTDGLGTVFEVASGGTYTILYSFTGSDGALPAASLVMDNAGNLYGTTYQGGSSSNCGGGCGTIFKLATDNTETVLHSFSGSDGAFPQAALIRDKSGNMYGTAGEGGASADGTVFEYSRKGKFTTLHSFSGGSDGALPISPLVKKSGFLYGTTYTGGTSGEGTIFKTPAKAGSDTVLYSFTGGSDGGFPQGGLLYDGGKYFGTAFGGGDSGCTSDVGCGTVFEIAP